MPKKNEIPDGKPPSYKSMIDLCLMRQEQHVYGIPHWPEHEKRMVLGYIAWIGQKEGEKLEKGQRQAVWKREALVEIIRDLISTGKYGRFTAMKPDDAEDLLKFFIHPSLLTAPKHDYIEFAHLGFQEYMCAEFLHARARIMNFGDYLKKELFSRLGKPGWLEVGMFFMEIHSERTKEGHFELLGMLDPSDRYQAELLVRALTGRELPFTNEERKAWLPVMIGCAITHPYANIGGYLSVIPSDLKKTGINMIKRLFEADDPESQWNILSDMEKLPPEINLFFHKLRERWITPTKDDGCQFEFGEDEARSAALLMLIVNSRWAKEQSGGIVLSPDSPLSTQLADWLERKGPLAMASPILWNRNEDNFPMPSNTVFILDALIPEKGLLWNNMLTQIPLDALILQGELHTDFFNFYFFSQPCILLSLYPDEQLPFSSRLAVGFYQASVFFEGMAEGNPFEKYSESRSAELVRSRSQARSRTLILAHPRSKALARSLARSRSRSLDVTKWLYLAQMLKPPLPQLLAHTLALGLTLVRSLKLVQAWPMTPDLISKLKKIKAIFSEENRFDDKHKHMDTFLFSLECFLYRHAALDWFAEQTESPDLIKRRGLRLCEPLPEKLGLFDHRGMPFPVQKRENLLRLRRWLDDDDAVLEFFFPEGLPEKWKKHLRSDMEILKKQPWSPQAALDAVLEEWPETEPEKPYTQEYADEMLSKACDEFLESIQKNDAR